MLLQRSHTAFRATLHSGPTASLPSCVPHRPSRGAWHSQCHSFGSSYNNAAGSLTTALPNTVQRLQQLRSAVIPLAQAGTAGGGGSTGGSGSSGGAGGGSSGAAGGDDKTPHPMRNWTWAYAAFLAVGGVFAFVKAGSQKSLTSALGAALILTLSGRSMFLGSARGSLAVCAAISLFLSVIMAGRYSRTRKVMPAGMTAGASIAMSAAYILSLVA